ncbi:MAG: HAMP domain-containing histidine kinase, partial [Planctomycetales bacterium]|nr:HAMP domain-containing histidine kinase [Planctomycetales bacterium]
NAYSFRGLVRSISQRASELPDAIALVQHVSALRATLPPPSDSHQLLQGGVDSSPIGWPMVSFEFERRLNDVEVSLSLYRERINESIESDGPIGAPRRELNTVQEMESLLRQLYQLGDENQGNWMPPNEVDRTAIVDAVESLNRLAEQLPQDLQEKMQELQGDVRGYYRTWIVLTWLTSISAGLLFFVLIQLFWRWVFRPLNQLIRESRRVAGGDFDHRIHLNSGDEMDELAQAMNDMTQRFQEIRDDLDQQVRQRTREVIRGEQLASVGFLAAGVAHEINNPLASIAWSAEALESRLHEILHIPHNASKQAVHAYDADQIEVLRKYLKRIQDEAFRCKGITERLLDFSRLGESQRKQETDIHQSITDVVALVKHLGQYRNRTLDFRGATDVMAWVSPTEFKQVILNLLTNSLDACEEGGTVHAILSRDEKDFTLTVSDDGCGMTEEVLKHLFEPFFTRRRDGRGTGLGLSITYRIVQDHGGSLVPSSAGPDQGSTFVLTLPLKSAGKGSYERLKAAA